MTDVNHRDTETRGRTEDAWVGRDAPLRRGSSAQYPNLSPCVFRVSVSLWLTSVIERHLWLYSSLTRSSSPASMA